MPRLEDSADYAPVDWGDVYGSAMRWILFSVVLAVAGAGLFALGRHTAGGSSGESPTAAYARGFRDGRASGLEEGRALQVAPAGRSAFKAGYVAGADDVFGGYDGGWSLGARYVVTLEDPPGPQAYAIVRRSLLSRNR
jgi:hypothetical protein